jgi:hypothetical protein
VFMDADFGGHRLAWQAVRTSQDRPASLRQRPGNTMTTNLPLQVRPLLLAQHQRRDRPRPLIPAFATSALLYTERFELSTNVTNLRSR